LEDKTYRNELRAAKSILAGVCDAVVEADPELRLVEPSHGLANVLMMNPRRCLAGDSLQSFFATGADCDKFAQEVKSSITNDGICRAFHVSMRDSCGISVPMEVFCVPFHSSCGKESYLIGFQEFADVPLPVRRQQLSAGLPAARLNADDQSTLQSREAGTTNSGASTDSGTADSEAGTTDSGAVPEASILIDALSPGLAMLRCSSAFELLAGASWSHIGGEGRSLLQCTRPDLRDDLAYWISRCLEEPDGGEAAVSPTVEKVRFRFCEQHHRFRLTIQSKVTLILDPPDGQDWPVGLGEPSRVVKLVLEKPRWIQGDRWTRTRRAASLGPDRAPSPPSDPERALLDGGARGRSREVGDGAIVSL
jgi:hypothetical protein